MKFLYLDCAGGVSGDMLLGAFLDSLVPLDYLENTLKKLKLKGYHLELQDVERHHIHAKKVDVVVKSHKHHHRTLADIEAIINKSQLSEFVKTHSIAVFRRLAEAEARVHQQPVEAVHFHEVGAVDAIVDIVGTTICIEYLNPDAIYSSPLPISDGTVTAAHGVLPVPAPATLNLLKDFPVHHVSVEGELVTPTGAALVTHFSQGRIPERLSFRIQSIGYGAGSKQFEAIPNYLRIWQGQLDVQSIKEIALQIETNIDDLNPEVYPYLAEQLYAAGAQDVSFYPTVMKKGRPGVLVVIIAQPPLLTSLKEILFRETTTIGLRFHYVFREKLEREIVTIETEWGAVRAKKVIIDGETRIYPEFEECKRIARISGKPLIEIQQSIIQLAHQQHHP